MRALSLVAHGIVQRIGPASTGSRSILPARRLWESTDGQSGLVLST